MLEINQKSLTVPLIQGGMGVGVSLGNFPVCTPAGRLPAEPGR